MWEPAAIIGHIGGDMSTATIPYYLPLENLPEPAALAAHLYSLVFRTDLEVPGFALASLPATLAASTDLRRLMVGLAAALADLHEAATGRRIAPLSAMRFDQQVTTKFHLDGGPDESYLLLGYEPSTVASVLSMADLARAAQDSGETPAAYLAAHNPLLPDGERRLAPYATFLDAFDPARVNILLINNSRAGFGVLHRAVIPTPDSSRSRIIHSMQIGPEDAGALDSAALEAFVTTQEVSGGR